MARDSMARYSSSMAQTQKTGSKAHMVGPFGPLGMEACRVDTYHTPPWARMVEKVQKVDEDMLENNLGFLMVHTMGHRGQRQGQRGHNMVQEGPTLLFT